ncbi:hypothetical protein E4U21_005849 [Claviceps maximensis]|nr:hypothetical protein E4U21_005849 [Claviceps maximensis]
MRFYAIVVLAFAVAALAVPPVVETRILVEVGRLPSTNTKYRLMKVRRTREQSSEPSPDCKLDSAADQATCTIVAASGTLSTGTISTVISGYMHMTVPVTITAGADKLTASSDPSPTGTSASAASLASATATATATNAAGMVVARNGAVWAGVVAGVLAL